VMLCGECRHYQPAELDICLTTPEECTHPATAAVDVVTGKRSRVCPRAARRGACGPEAALFEARPPEPPSRGLFEWLRDRWVRM